MMAENGLEAKPNLGDGEAKNEPGDGFIKLKVVSQDNNEVHFRVKSSTALSRLKKGYADRMGVAVKDLRFQFDGQAVGDDQTPETLNMENDDVIDVFQEQLGGCQLSN